MTARRPIALLVSYDGTDFAGWQYQPDRHTVQGEIQSRLDTVHGVPPGTVTTVGSGRTDAGVHALGQVASYRPPTPRRPEVLVAALAKLLPDAIRVLGVAETEPGFHACRSAAGKTYRYRLVNRSFLLPFEARWSWHLRPALDLAAMRAAAASLCGTHDFAGFATAGGQTETTVRSVRRLDVIERGGGVIEIEAEADGFLYRMVRNITGLLVEIGRGRRPIEDAARVLVTGRREHAGTTAPARGLCLCRVHYPAGTVPW